VKPRVLVVDDDEGIRYTLREILESSGFVVDEAADGEAGLERFNATPADLVITDLRMPKLDGMGLLTRLRAFSPAPRVVVITAHGSERQAVVAMQAGACDYFRKPFEMEELLAVVRRAVESTRLALENEKLRCEISLSRRMVFASEAMRRLALLAGRAAPRDVTVLISGESGTGKERLAEAIVAGSRRADKPFVRFNCAALTPELAEAELNGDWQTAESLSRDIRGCANDLAQYTGSLSGILENLDGYAETRALHAMQAAISASVTLLQDLWTQLQERVHNDWVEE